MQNQWADMERRWTEQFCHQGSGSCEIETLNTEVHKLGLDLTIMKEKEGVVRQALRRLLLAMVEAWVVGKGMRKQDSYRSSWS